MSIDANDEDQCKQAKRRDLPVSPYHKGVRVGEEMMIKEKKLRAFCIFKRLIKHVSGARELIEFYL